MKKNYTKFIIFCCLIISVVVHAQNSNKSVEDLYLELKKTDIELGVKLISELEKKMMTAPKEVINLADKLIPVAQKTNDKTTEVNLNRLKGSSNFYLGNFAKAEEISLQTILLANKLKVKTALPKIYATVGNAQIYQSKLTEGLENQNKGLKIAEELNDKPIIHLIKNNLVAIHLQFNDFEIAEQYLHDNIAYFSSVPTATMPLATSYNNLALIYEKQKKYRKSIDYLLLANKQKGVESNKVLLAQIYNNLGNGYNKINSLDSSYHYFKKALEVNTAAKIVKSQGASKVGISEYYYKIKQFNKAKINALQAYEIGKSINSLDVIKESSEQLFKIYNQLNLADSSIFYYNQYSKLADSIVNQDNTRQVTKIKMQYDFNKKEDEYKHQQVLNELNLQQELLKNKLNKDELDKSLQEQNLQFIALENQKLLNSKNTQKLKIETQEKILAQNKNKTLEQENKLKALQLKQFWLYGLIGIIILGLLAYMFWNRARINKYKFDKKLKEKETEELLHKNRATESELKAIRSQMNPHFIFNVLNSIESYIVENDANNAQGLVQKFAKLSRMILENSSQPLSTLKSEWKINQIYTEIEHIRFDKHFNYNFINNINGDFEDYLIPPMMIQPIIENAILHGLRSEMQENALLNVTLNETEDTIQIIVDDNGTGLKTKSEKKPSYKKSSFGLSSIKNRIEILNESNGNNTASFNIIDKNTIGSKGCIATLILPKVKSDNKD